MISGKLDYVFSGEDDLQVVLPLPLAFLRLVLSGVYAYEIDWQNSEWETAEPTSEQLSIIEGALSTIANAIDGDIAQEDGGMVWLDSSLLVNSQSGTTNNPAQVQVLKSSFPLIQDAQGVILRIKSSANERTTFTGFKYSSAANQIIKTVEAGDNQFDQLIIPCDDTGFKINIQVFDQTYWNYEFHVNGYW